MDIKDKVINWMVSGEVGASSKTMAAWLGADKKGRYPAHPYDPDDFNRCLLLLDYIPEFRNRLHEMAEISATWAALVARWSEIEESFLNEAGLDWSKSNRAPDTYALMRSIIEQ